VIAQKWGALARLWVEVVRVYHYRVRAYLTEQLTDIIDKLEWCTPASTLSGVGPTGRPYITKG
jgi:hypothetical protein